MEFRTGEIEGVVVKQLPKHVDGRGWLSEFFRQDELPDEYYPAMGYVSVTMPNVTRGPHEHIDQADIFCFLGPGEFKVTLWDNRPHSPTYCCRTELYLGASNAAAVIVPKGIVHGYRCISAEPGWVINCPNQLYMGQGKLKPVDEIRHEADPNNPFVLDEVARRVVMA